MTLEGIIVQTPKLPEIKYIWVDVDKTLYCPNEALDLRIRTEVLKTLADLQKVDVDENNPDYVAMCEDYDKRYAKYDSHTKSFKSLDVDPFFAREAHNFPEYADYISQDPKLVEMFRTFEENNLPFSLYSNNHHNTVTRVIEKLGMKVADFEFPITGEHNPKAAADKRGYKLAIRFSQNTARAKMGIDDLLPNQILFVGDRQAIDIKPAQEVGMQTALVNWGRDVATTADYIVDDIYKIRRLVLK